MTKKRKRKKQNIQLLPRKLIVRTNPKDVISEQFRTIRTNIKFSMPQTNLKTILVTSSATSEGKSTISANLACLFAEEGKRVLLIDSDLRRPTMHFTFRVNNTVGLSNILTLQSILDEAIKHTEIPCLDIITSGPIPINPAELLGSTSFEVTLNLLKETYDMIILDAPPILAVTDAQLIAAQTDGTILVVDTGVTKKEAASKAKELLEAAHAKILGVVMNNFKMEKSQYSYSYYGNTQEEII